MVFWKKRWGEYCCDHRCDTCSPCFISAVCCWNARLEGTSCRKGKGEVNFVHWEKKIYRVWGVQQGMNRRIYPGEIANSLLALRNNRNRRLMKTKLKHSQFITTWRMTKMTKAIPGSKDMMSRVTINPSILPYWSQLSLPKKLIHLL